MTIEQHIRELFTAHYSMNIEIDLPLRQAADIVVREAVDWVLVHRLTTMDELYAIKSLDALLELGHVVTLARGIDLGDSNEAQQLAAEMVAAWELFEARTRDAMRSLAESPSASSAKWWPPSNAGGDGARCHL
jgi:hypothetical protein